MVSYPLPTQQTISLELVYSCWLDVPTVSVSLLIPSTFLMMNSLFISFYSRKKQKLWLLGFFLNCTFVYYWLNFRVVVYFFSLFYLVNVFTCYIYFAGIWNVTTHIEQLIPTEPMTKHLLFVTIARRSQITRIENEIELCVTIVLTTTTINVDYYCTHKTNTFVM